MFLRAYYNKEGTAFFSKIWKENKRDIVNFTKWDIPICHDVALDEIFLDDDAVDIGHGLYGLYCEKHKHVLMKTPDSKERGRHWIPRNLKERN